MVFSCEYIKKKITKELNASHVVSSSRRSESSGLRGFTLLVVALGLVVRWAVALGPHSGQGRPPMFGDYEAQRHWQEVTVNLPLGQWYTNSSKNDLGYWGLDYPPLTAYHSWALGRAAHALDPDFVKLTDSRGVESDLHRLFMRFSALLAELAFYLPPLLIYMRDLKTNPVLAVLYPGLILIDHGHFQYNSVSLGLTLAAVVALKRRRLALGSMLFSLAINYKQMSLYHSLPFFCYLLGICLRQPTWPAAFSKLAKIATAVVLTFAALWAPFLYPKPANALQEVNDESDGCGQKFRVVVVSPLFEGKPMLQCHKLVNAALKDELQQIHAFSQKTFSTSQWEKQAQGASAQSATCSAPGKVILFGEHSVVYKKTAVAACVSKRTKVCLTTGKENFILMDMPEVGLSQFRVDLPAEEGQVKGSGNLANSLLGSLLEDPGVQNFGTVDKSDENLLDRLDWWANIVEKHKKVKFSEQALSVLAYLHSFLTPRGKFCQGLSVKVTSDIRPGAGVGSSAAYAVALAGAFGRLHSANLDNAKVKDLAWQAERLVHGKPSGLDTTVVCDGEIVRFPIVQNANVPRPAWPLRILLVDSGVARNTKRMVEIAAEKLNEIGTEILEEMDQIAMKAILALTMPQEEGYKIIEDLVEKNHKCLVQLGVSHPALDQICSTAAHFGLKAKITGAGGGGNAFVLLPPNLTAEKVQELQNALQTDNFQSFEVTLFGPGITFD